MGASKQSWAVTCRKHGTEETGSAGIRYLKVGPPKGREHRKVGGCPTCKAEAAAAERMAKKSQ